MAWFRFPNDNEVRLRWTPPKHTTGQYAPYIDCFLYIDADGRLRFWDLGSACDVTLQISGYSSKLEAMGVENLEHGTFFMRALEPERVYAKWPSFFEAARSMGYWRDVKVEKVDDGAYEARCFHEA